MSSHLYDPVSQFTQYNNLMNNIEKKISSISEKQKKTRSKSVTYNYSPMDPPTRKKYLNQSYNEGGWKSNKNYLGRSKEILHPNYSQIMDILKPVVLDSVKSYLENYKAKIFFDMKEMVGNMIQSALDDVYKDIAAMNNKIFDEINRQKKVNFEKFNTIERRCEETSQSCNRVYLQTEKLGTMLRTFELCSAENKNPNKKKKKLKTKKLKKLKKVEDLNRSFRVFKSTIERSLDTLEHKIDHELLDVVKGKKDRVRKSTVASRNKSRCKSGCGRQKRRVLR